MHKKNDSLAVRRAYAAHLEKEIQALGGLCGGDPDFKENHPDLAIGYFERVLAEERRLNGPYRSIGVN
jgi:hypothetical protein